MAFVDMSYQLRSGAPLGRRGRLPPRELWLVQAPQQTLKIRRTWPEFAA
jgi:hypothetical protein